MKRFAYILSFSICLTAQAQKLWTVDAFSRRDSRNNTIYQYAMFSAIYRFSIYGGKNTMGTDKERKD